MGHQNILTLVDYFETMNNRMSLAPVSSDKLLVPGENTYQRDVIERATLARIPE